jgi:hypothetical protein
MSAAVGATHMCWSYDDLRPFDEFAREFLRAGLAAGERVWFVAGRRSGATGEWLRDVAESTRRPGTVRVISSVDAYPGPAAVDPAGQVDAYVTATADALAAGFTGLRVVADVTELVRTGEQRKAFARYEYVIGRHIRTAPMRAVCAYDRLELGDRVVAELACLHATSGDAPGVTFWLHPGTTPDVAILDGDLDQDAEKPFATALGHADLEPVDGTVTVDAGGLRFIDHRSLLTLQHYADARRITVVVRTGLGTAARIAALLDLPRVRVEAAG